MCNCINYNIVIYNNSDCKKILVEDSSQWDELPSSYDIELKVPGFNKVLLTIDTNTINSFDSSDLGITQNGESLVTLPDGIYCVCARLCDKLFCKSFIRTCKLECQLSNLYASSITAKDGKLEETEDVSQAEKAIKAAHAAMNCCKEDQAIKLFSFAKELLNSQSSNCGC